MSSKWFVTLFVLVQDSLPGPRLWQKNTVGCSSRDTTSKQKFCLQSICSTALPLVDYEERQLSHVRIHVVLTVSNWHQILISCEVLLAID